MAPYPYSPAEFSTELLIDRSAFAQLAKPANLVTMEFDPYVWGLNNPLPHNIYGIFADAPLDL